MAGWPLCANMTETSCVIAISEQGGKEIQHGNDKWFCPACDISDGDFGFSIGCYWGWARSAAPESRGCSSRETAYFHGRVQTGDPGRSGCGQRVRRDRGRASTPWPVFFASDEVASGTQVGKAGRVGCAEARAEVEGQSTDRGESETAARQRAADGSAAQGGNRDRRSKKVAMLLGLPIAETEVS